MTFLIVAISGRALAQSAHRGGLASAVVDCFGDLDTREVAGEVTVVPDLTPAALTAAVDQLWARLSPRGLVPGSGLESNPDVVARMGRDRCLYGNDPAVTAAVKDPAAFFGALDRLAVPHPETHTTSPAIGGDWLRKRIGGTGGAHIRAVPGDVSLRPDEYLQRRVEGESYSVLFLTDGRETAILGYNRHWVAQSAARMPFRQSGAVQWPAVYAPWRTAVDRHVRAIAAHFGLRGLCGMDFMIDGAGAPMALEINPRPPSTFELHEGVDSLFVAHLEACAGRLTSPRLRADGIAASAVCYAETAGEIPAGFHWPVWVADRPVAGRHITGDEPLCTVFGTGADPDGACRQVAERLDDLRMKLAAKAISIARPLAAPSHRPSGPIFIER